MRLYQYADLFKEKREMMKTKIDLERGDEMRFTPNLSATKSAKTLKTIKESPSKDILLLSVKKPGSIHKKRTKYYDSLGAKSTRKSDFQTKTTIYNLSMDK